MIAAKSLTLASMVSCPLRSPSRQPHAPTPDAGEEAGMPAQNCQYCHVAAMPKKEGFKPDDLNERGKWLLGEKGQAEAKDVKAEWLKNYPGGK